MSQQQLGVPLPWGGYGGGGVGRGGGEHQSKEEYGRIIHCDTPKYRSMYGGRSDYRVMEIKTVVVTGRDKLHTGAGSGGRGDGGTMEG